MSEPPSRGLFHALIRTHHITSRKKLQRVRRAAEKFELDALLVRSGGSPGIMFAEGRDETRMAAWVSAVQALRYKDFRCVAKPTLAPTPAGTGRAGSQVEEDIKVKGVGTFWETASMAEFARRMEERGLGAWWRKGMGYEND